MNLDELLQEIRSVSSDPVVQKFSSHLTAWKDGPATVSDLATTAERYIGNTWISAKHDHDLVYSLWSKFRRENIDTIHGMTMNERLFAFGLLERFQASNNTDREAMYSKLLASAA